MSKTCPRRRWGQNFLTDANISRKIVSAALDAPKPRRIIEIGPGQGALTGLLLAQGEPYLGIEIDPQLADLLSVRFAGEPHFNLLQEDVLKVDFGRLADPDAYNLVVGNIPYNITSPILFQLLDASEKFYHAVLMMQKEVGERLIAAPNTKAYGLLAIHTQICATVESLFTVPSTVFSPRPKVDSIVVRLRFDQTRKGEVLNYSFFRKVLRCTFQQRRKMLRKSLSSLFQTVVLDKLTADLTRRPEQLSIPEWIALSNELYRFSNKESAV
jgi:16S rRNA (adenine1518-N6/adenine1519-N6)-dimethyltransferase